MPPKSTGPTARVGKQRSTAPSHSGARHAHLASKSEKSSKSDISIALSGLSTLFRTFFQSEEDKRAEMLDTVRRTAFQAAIDEGKTTAEARSYSETITKAYEDAMAKVENADE